MGEFDRLPAELRGWLASAHLPWRPISVRRAYARAYKATGDTSAALRKLDQIQQRMITRDAHAIWGADHPDAKADQAGG